MKLKFQHLAAIVTLTMALPAAADVIYSNYLNTAIPTNFTGVTINVGAGTLNPFFGGVGVANNAALQPFRNGTNGLDPLLNFTFGDTIDGSVLNLSSGAGGSQTHVATSFTAGTEGYIGFKLNNTDYGWMRVLFTNNTGGAVVKDWAYDTSGAAISVGGIRQVGQDVILSSGFTVSSAINDSGGATNLLKNSSGSTTTVTSASNAYTGSTSVTVGTLAVGGSGSINTSSGVTINGGTFRYNSTTALSPTVTFTSGTVGGTNLTGSLGGLSIGTNQTLSPGAAAGPGTAATTSQTWASGGTYKFEINNATGTAGSDPGWDLVNGSGALNISASSGSQFNIDLTSLGLNDLSGNAVNFSDLTSTAWLLADFGSVTNFAANAFNIDRSHFSNTFAGTFGVALGDTVSGGDNSQIYLTYTAVPEPGAALLGGIGLLALLRRRRSSQ